jgi:hypothetical protein
VTRFNIYQLSTYKLSSFLLEEIEEARPCPTPEPDTDDSDEEREELGEEEVEEEQEEEEVQEMEEEEHGRGTRGRDRTGGMSEGLPCNSVFNDIYYQLIRLSPFSYLLPLLL